MADFASPAAAPPPSADACCKATAASQASDGVKQRDGRWAEVIRDRQGWLLARQLQEPPADRQHANRAWWADPSAVVENPVWENFFFDHLVPNVPCVFGPRLTQHWPIYGAATDGGWVKREKDGREVADMESVVRIHGGPDVAIPVSHCAVDPLDASASSDNTAYHSMPCEMRLCDFVEHLEMERLRWSSKDDTGAGHADESATAVAPPPLPDSLVYLKDWHMLRDLPKGVSPPHDTPFLFAGDYLNEFSLSTRADDYKFTYLGPRGTRTLMHTDVLGSHSWTTSIVGRKRWVFFPPEVRPCLEDSGGRFLNDVVHGMVDPTRFPRYEEANSKRIELVQMPGQTLFVPSGWPHQVENMDECLSVNANWVNASNLDRLVAAVCEDLSVAQREIADVRSVMTDDWHASCHRMVKANCGFDLETVCELIEMMHKRVTAQLAEAATATSAAAAAADDDDAKATATAAVHLSRDGGRVSIDSASSLRRCYNEFELMMLRDSLREVLDRWADTLDPSAVIPDKFTNVASILEEQCRGILERLATSTYDTLP